MGGGGGWLFHGWWDGGVRRTKKKRRRQEMRKENEKKCLPKLWWDATIALAEPKIRAEENWKEAHIGGEWKERKREKIGRGMIETLKERNIKAFLYYFFDTVFWPIGRCSLVIKAKVLYLHHSCTSTAVMRRDPPLHVYCIFFLLTTHHSWTWRAIKDVCQFIFTFWEK